MALEIVRKKDKSLKSKWWYGRFEINGKSKCANLGIEIKGEVPPSLRKIGDPRFERSRAQAQVALDQLVKEARSHKAAEKHLQDLYELKAGDALQNAPLSHMEAVWDELPSKKTRSAKWRRTQHGSLKAFRDYTVKKHPNVEYMSQITHTMAKEWMRKLDEKGFGAETYNHKLILLRSVFVPTAGTGVLRNPFEGIFPKRKTNVHREPFTTAELTAVIEHCDDLFRPIFITGMCTAMRRGDCCLLKWESVDLVNDFITVNTSKTGETAEIPMFPLLKKEIEKRPRKGIYVFPEAAKMYQVNHHGISWRLKQALKAADIEMTRPSVNKKNASNVKGFHSLRTTWITMALSAGVPMELVRRVTGHSTVNIVLKHYFRPGREDFREALESALPQAMTGGTREKKSPAERLQDLIAKAGDLEKETLIEEMAKIAEQLAA